MDNSRNLKSQLESLLFMAHKPLTVAFLAKLLDAVPTEVKAAVEQLKQDRADSGVVLLQADEGYQLASRAENAEVVKNFLNADLREKLTEATVEVLAIIAYRQPISKSEIEAIRGVNSQYGLRTLMMRGLVEKIPNPNDARGQLYQVTTEFLQTLGLTSIDDLPEFEQLVSQIKLPEQPQAQD